MRSIPWRHSYAFDWCNDDDGGSDFVCLLHTHIHFIGIALRYCLIWWANGPFCVYTHSVLLLQLNFVQDLLLVCDFIRLCKMESMNSFWQLGDELRGQSKVSEDHKWLMVASKLAEQTRSKGERFNNLDLSKGPSEIRPRDRNVFQEDNKFENLNFNMLNLEPKVTDNMNKSNFRNGLYNMNAAYPKSNANVMGNVNVNKHNGNHNNKELSSNSNNSNTNNENTGGNSAMDKRFKTLPASETLPRNEVLGGYIFVCNNDTMQEDLKRQLFGNSDFLALYSPHLTYVLCWEQFRHFTLINSYNMWEAVCPSKIFLHYFQWIFWEQEDLETMHFCQNIK